MANILCYLLTYAAVVLNTVHGSCNCRTRRNYLLTLDDSLNPEDIQIASKFVGNLAINLRSLNFENRLAVATFTRLISSFAESHSEETFESAMQELILAPSKNSTLKLGVETVNNILGEDEAYVPTVIVFIIANTADFPAKEVTELYDAHEFVRGFSIGIDADVDLESLNILAGRKTNQYTEKFENLDDLNRFDLEVGLEICGLSLEIQPPSRNESLTTSSTPRTEALKTSKTVKTTKPSKKSKTTKPSEISKTVKTKKPISKGGNATLPTPPSNLDPNCEGLEWEYGASKEMIEVGERGSESYKPTYICRALVKGRWRLGGLSDAKKGCKFVDAESGEEPNEIFDQYQVLVAKDSSNYEWKQFLGVSMERPVGNLIIGGERSNGDGVNYIARCSYKDGYVAGAYVYNRDKPKPKSPHTFTALRGSSYYTNCYIGGVYHLMCSRENKTFKTAKPSKTVKTTKPYRKISNTVETKKPISKGRNDALPMPPSKLDPNCEGLEWKYGASEGMIEGGSENGKPTYICRQLVKGRWRLGGLTHVKKGCKFVDATSKKEAIEVFDQYQVLIAKDYSNYKWKPYQWGSTPVGNLIIGGERSNGDGEVNYIGKCYYGPREPEYVAGAYVFKEDKQKPNQHAFATMRGSHYSNCYGGCRVYHLMCSRENR